MLVLATTTPTHPVRRRSTNPTLSSTPFGGCIFLSFLSLYLISKTKGLAPNWTLSQWCWFPPFACFALSAYHHFQESSSTFPRKASLSYSHRAVTHILSGQLFLTRAPCLSQRAQVLPIPRPARQPLRSQSPPRCLDRASHSHQVLHPTSRARTALNNSPPSSSPSSCRPQLSMMRLASPPQPHRLGSHPPIPSHTR